MSTLNVKVAGSWVPMGGDVNASNPINDFISFWTPTVWTNVTLINGWVDVGINNQTTQYRKRGDMIDIRGYVRNGTIGQPVFLLPVGFRPLKDLVFAVDNYLSTNAHGTVLVYASTGGVTPAAPGIAGSYFPLNFSFAIS